MINVLIADDHQLLIDGIKTVLEEVEDISVVAEASNGYKVLEKLESGIQVDVILMDINMPLLDGLNCTKMVVKKFPDVKVIALSQYDEKRFVKQMVKNGASGYLLKDTAKDILVKAIKTVHGGEKYFCERLSLRLINQELKMQDTKALFPKLSRREVEILRLIGKEYSSQQIADKLFISFHTVESHRANLMFKAGVKNTAGLMRWAVENDLLD
ncbi:MAG: response regulator transcription factor [Bacteroidales bacterium]|nr:response regulator transcription factor [Bacteroidales bacterium]